MRFAKSSVILVTGASQGIGFSIAEGFAKAGYRVIGVARKLPQQKYSFDAQQMDVTQIESIQKLNVYLKNKYERLDVLVNNAGFGIAGPIEETSIEQVQNLFLVNVFGLHQTTQVFLPLLKQTKGLIINIGSVAGDFTIPFQTFYSMSKASVASYSEGLRQELKPWGVRVVNVKPGDTRSAFSQRRQTTLAPQSPYTSRVLRSIAVMEKDEKNGMSPQSVYQVCARLVHQKNPPIHVTVGMMYRLLQILKKFLPVRLIMSLIYRIYGK